MPQSLRKRLYRIVVFLIGGLLALVSIADIPWGNLLDADNDPSPSPLFDLFERVLAENSERPLVSNPIVVSIDGCSRSRIGTLLSKLADYETACIALDVIFAEINESDSILIEGLTNASPFLLWPYADSDIPSNEFYFSELMEFATPVDIRLNSFSTLSKVRYLAYPDSNLNFRPMALEAAHRVNPEIADSCERVMLSDKELPILYSIGDIEVYSASEVLDGPAGPSEFQGRAIILGTTAGFDDVHPTATGIPLPGVMIHALSAASILSGKFPKKMSPATAWIIAAAIAWMFLWVAIRCHDKDYGNLVSRILPIALLVSFAYFGFLIYRNFNYIVDISPIILWPAAVLLADDVITGVIAIWRLFKPKFNSLLKKFTL